MILQVVPKLRRHCLRNVTKLRSGNVGKIRAFPISAANLKLRKGMTEPYSLLLNPLSDFLVKKPLDNMILLEMMCNAQHVTFHF